VGDAEYAIGEAVDDGAMSRVSMLKSKGETQWVTFACETEESIGQSVV
jgi:hypothetical protein